MPATLARSASSRPTRAAASLLPVRPPRSSPSTVPAAASVRPLTSSMTWALMCLLDRNTARRGRSAVPRTCLRTRACRRRRASCLSFVVCVIGVASLRRLARLAVDDLTQVAHTLALVGLGLAQPPDVGRHLADELLVDTPHGDARRCRNLEGDAFGRVDRHHMAEPQGQLDAVGTLRRSAVADADDLELLGEPLGDADNHVVHQRTGETVQGAVPSLVVGPLHEDVPVLLADGDVLGDRPLEVALRPLDGDAPAGD